MIQKLRCPYVWLYPFSAKGSDLINAVLSSAVRTKPPSSLGILPNLIAGTSHKGLLLDSTNSVGVSVKYGLIWSHNLYTLLSEYSF